MAELTDCIVGDIDGHWWFYDDTYGRHGPFDSYDEAEKALFAYLNGNVNG